MSLAVDVETLPQPRGGNYELARFNALRHGVLSQHTVLPWEDGEEYLTLLEALVAEHKPQGPTEEHLVEELAGVIWRKRRLRLGERAAHHRALMSASDPDQRTAEAALIGVAEDVEVDTIDDAIRATEPQTPEDRADLEDDQAMTKEALRILRARRPRLIPVPWPHCGMTPGHGGKSSSAGMQTTTRRTRYPMPPMPLVSGGSWKPKSWPGTRSGVKSSSIAH